MDTNELYRLILNLVRKGTILAVDHDKEVCRVQSGDLETNWINWLALAAGETTDWNPPTVGELVLLFCPGGDPTEGVALRGINTDEVKAPSHKPTTHTRRYPDGAVIEYDHEAHALTVTMPEGGTAVFTVPASVTINTKAATINASDSATVNTKAATINADDSATIKSKKVTIDAPDTLCTGNLTVQKTLAYLGGMTGSGSAPGSGGKAAKINGGIDATDDITAKGISLVKHVHQEQGDGKDVGPAK
ncbi:phage baseplate assembly protein V [Pseudoduganella sp. FT55W]|uniref:Phage baseplate assembly protein V n=1 Tax=Duganella rivi TaxID=2666083 RepID=A0A7X4GVY2_9BURK|nr:phage baseplate assembly protein V [Duganella rivi]MYM70533.1 phage baseplate assembly protein V [Duganella rivi]